MYIKKVILKGYKSFQKKVVINFSKGLNVVVGRNGSGKSNLLSALQLILADEETNRKRKIHALVNHNQTAMRGESAYVEIVFDNQDGLFPEDTLEVTFKRVLTGIKDKFYINDRQVDRFDKYLVQIGLVSPYSFVQQGRVTQLATMNDRARLEMMRVVSGESGWVSILSEITKINSNSQLLLEVILETLRRLSGLKPQLKDQAAELIKYHEEEEKKRGAEYVIYTHEIENIRKAIQELEKDKSKLTEKSATLKHTFEKLSKNKDKANLEALAIGRTQNTLKNLIDSNRNKLQELESEKNRLELIISEEPNELAGGGRKSPEELKKEIEEIEKILTKIEPKYNELIEVEKEQSQHVNRQVMQITQLRELMTEVGGKNYKPTEKPMDFFNKYSTELHDQQTQAQLKVDEQNTKIIGIQQEMDNIKNKLETMKVECQNHVSVIKDLMTSLTNYEKEKHGIENTKHSNSTTFSEIEEKLARTKEELEQQHQKMGKAFGRNVMQSYIGMNVVINSLKETENFNSEQVGYYGTVLENITCSEALESAVQVAGGIKLFYHIVKNNTVGLKLLREFNRLKCKSEVRFIALDRLEQDGNIIYPQDDDGRIVPIINQLTFRDEVESAMKFVFGKTLHCVNAEVAMDTARNHRLNCVTSDGDKFSSSGIMTGGYRDMSMNAVSFMAAKKKLYNRKNSLLERLNANEESDKECNAALLELSKKMEQVETQLARENNNVRTILDQMKALREQSRNIDLIMKTETRKLESLTKVLNDMNENEKFFNQVKETKNIVNKAGELMATAVKERDESIQSLKQINRKLKKYRQQQSSLTGRLENVKEMLEEAFDGSQTILPNINNDLQAYAQEKLILILESIARLKKEIEEDEEELAKDRQKGKDMDDKLQKLDDLIESQQKNISNEELNLLKVKDKIFELEKKIDQTNELLARIGAYPAQADAYHGQPLGDLYNVVQEGNAYIHEHAHVNFRAQEQYKDAKRLIKKVKNNLIYFNKIDEVLAEMIQKVDSTRSEVCIATVRSVQKSFRDIFKELVLSANGTPGYGRFAPYGDGFDFRETHSLEDGKRWWEENYFLGASLRVNFNDEWADDKLTDILQLSGGQKSIVALAFLLAVQETNPEALYVFDEVDQALDPSFREAIAKKMKDLSKNAQFVCTTFRKEFVEYADSFLGVSYQNQNSNVRPATKAEALDFVQPDETSSSSVLPTTSSFDGSSSSPNGNGNGNQNGLPSSVNGHETDTSSIERH